MLDIDAPTLPDRSCERPDALAPPAMSLMQFPAALAEQLDARSPEAGVACPVARAWVPASESQLDTDARGWMTLIQCRDETGLRRLHAAARRRVFVCAMGIVRHDEIAHEIVSTSFMQVWTNASRYDPERGSVIAWLLLIARSRSLDALRRARLIWAWEIGTGDDDASIHELACDAASDPPSHLERRNRGRRLQRALLRLSPIQRQVLSLTTIDGLSQDEASRHLDLPLGTVKSHARRGLAVLRRRCEAMGLASD